MTALIPDSRTTIADRPARVEGGAAESARMVEARVAGGRLERTKIVKGRAA
jgi:hypothetical protein